MIKKKQAEKMLEKAFRDWLFSDSFKKFEQFRSLLHGYSFWNTVLILSQKENATYCLGFRAWQKINRHVKKGEKAIKIFAPILKKERSIDENGKEKIEEILMGFRLVSVFDVSQTEGEPLPVPECENGEFEVDELKESIRNMGYHIEYYNGGTADGYVTNKSSKTIHIRNGLNPLQEASTLVHEWMHLNIGNKELSYAEEEVVVQVGAYFALLEMGADVSGYSAKYIQSWSDSKDFAKIRHLFSASYKLAQKFVKKMELETKVPVVA